MSLSTRLTIKHIPKDFSIERLNDPAWKNASQTIVAKYWSGKAAPAGRQFTARLLWSATALYVRFEAKQTEPLIVGKKLDLTKKTLKLWDRDVCEIFIAPDKSDPRYYFEFEIAPNGEWLDLKIHWMPDGRYTDYEYASGMKSAASVERDNVVMAMKISWTAFEKTPKAGDVWLGNLFRCVGKKPNRGYLAWQPTMTEKPNFHIPDKFGKFEFAESPHEVRAN